MPELTAARVGAAFLETADLAASVLARPEVVRFWEAPSALRLLSVGGLAGHLVRGATTVEVYLDRPEPEGEPISAAEYYARALPENGDITTPIHTASRERGEAQAPAIETLLEVARLRHGDLAVLRALARRERDPVRALRVM